jgi:hypothetical protein
MLNPKRLTFNPKPKSLHPKPLILKRPAMLRRWLAALRMQSGEEAIAPAIQVRGLGSGVQGLGFMV